jgi:hypothetical protein
MGLLVSQCRRLHIVCRRGIDLDDIAAIKAALPVGAGLHGAASSRKVVFAVRVRDGAAWAGLEVHGGSY